MPCRHITETLDEPERYQTVYSKIPGSSAAPQQAYISQKNLLKGFRKLEHQLRTLHFMSSWYFSTGEGEKIEDHLMHAEYYIIPEETGGS